MQVGTYIDGRELTYAEESRQFAVGGTPVTLEQVLAYDAHGQIAWRDDAVREWAYGLQAWFTAQAAREEAAKREAEAAERKQEKASAKAQARAQRAVRAGERREALATLQAESRYGRRNPAMICPHCQQQGTVHTRPVTQKKGVSGGKATAAVLTGGISLLATGLSRKEQNTQAHCVNCNSTWFF